MTKVNDIISKTISLVEKLSKKQLFLLIMTIVILAFVYFVCKAWIDNKSKDRIIIKNEYNNCIFIENKEPILETPERNSDSAP